MRFERWFYTVQLRLRSLFRRRQVEQELDEEIRYHLERQIQEYIAKGITPEEARYAALRALGGIEQRKEECRDMRRVSFIENLLQDLHYGTRMLLKNPGFTVIAVFTLALGIGANTAIFSVVNAVLLRPLPYPEPEQLTRLLSMDMTRGARNIGASMPDYREWRKRNQSFAHLAAYRTSDYNISGDEEPERVVGARVDTDFFPLLGVNPAQGRGFSGEEGVYGNHRVVVLSDALWRRRFGDGARLDGQTIRLNGEFFTVVGVAPRGFRFPSNDVALWTPLALADNDEYNTRGNFWLSVIGRLKPGVTPAQAQNDLVNIHHQLEQEKITTGFYGRVETLAEAAVGDVRRTLLVLLGAVGCVLLIACVNVANLLLARASARASEIAVRATLGAGRGRLVRQLLTESLLIGALGAIAGLALAWWGVDALVRLEPDLPRLDTVKVDGRALGFTLGLAVVRRSKEAGEAVRATTSCSADWWWLRSRSRWSCSPGRG
jgi:predicted permease